MRSSFVVSCGVFLLALAFCQAGSLTAASQDTDSLPPGEGRTILEHACTTCHDLTEVTKFRGYYTRDDWRDIVKTMIEYGAKVQDKDVDVLVDYLAKTLGKRVEPVN